MFSLFYKFRQIINKSQSFEDVSDDDNYDGDKGSSEQSNNIISRQEERNILFETKLDMPKERIKELLSDFPELFLAKEKNILGTIVAATNEELEVKLQQKNTNMRIELSEDIKTECAHETGDRVYIQCYAEAEELFNGKIIEEYKVFAIKPAYKRKGNKCTVLEVYDDHAVLEHDGYISKSLLNQHSELNVGDILQVDLIESQTNNFKWRGIRFVPIKTKNTEEFFTELKRNHKVRPKGPPENVGRRRNYDAKLCDYANQVYSQYTCEVIPSISQTSSRRFKAVRIALFEVPLDLRNTYLNQYKNIREWRKNLETKYHSLKEELSFDNYLDRFQTLIWLEEVELFKNFRQYDCERAQFTREADCLALPIRNLAERRPSLAIGDKCRAYIINERVNDGENSKSTTQENDASTICFEGAVTSVLCDKVMLKFNDAFQTAYDGRSYRLEFFFARMGFRRNHFGILKMVKNLPKEYLFPTELRFRDKPQLDIRLDEKTGTLHTPFDAIQWHNPNLNRYQQRAVFNILRGETLQMPYIIYGPPGTGKTITLVETILQLVSNLPQSKILVGTPSNSASNLICSRLIETKGLHVGEMVRLVAFNTIERDQIPEHLLPYCATADMGEDETHENEMFTNPDGIQMNCSMSKLARFRITVGTCATLGKYMELGFPSNHFTHVLIDEAGQCTEPEAMIVINQVSKIDGQVILAGDPKQLPAIINNKYADFKGLSKSFLERLLEQKPYLEDHLEFENYAGFNPLLVTQLLLNYRSLPSILRIHNYLFYELKLKAMISDKDTREAKMLQKLKNVIFESNKRPESHGAYFYAVRGENIRENDSPSWCNPREANVVFQMTYKLYAAGIKPDNIGIITPYAKQVRLIRALFMEANIKSPKIGSVEEFQGQERDVILLSTVRTARREIMNYDFRFKLGFIKSERRMNVAISRARALLIVFGDPELLQVDQCWGIYISECRSNDSYYGIEEAKDNNSETIAPPTNIE